jgi:Entner-Doudoroff aldolase
MTAQDYVSFLGRERATAILRCDSQDIARRAMDAAVRGGFRSLEFTLTVPGALDLIEEFARRPGLVVGAGTVLEVDQAKEAVDRGASFLVSPVVDPAVIEIANALDIAVMPGTHTPTEMLAAHRAGAPFCKLFPAPGAGPTYVRSVLGPMPFLRIVPTNGVDLDNARDWLRAGAYALGFVTPLFATSDLTHARFDRIESRAEAILQAVRSVAS